MRFTKSPVYWKFRGHENDWGDLLKRLLQTLRKFWPDLALYEDEVEYGMGPSALLAVFPDVPDREANCHFAPGSSLDSAVVLEYFTSFTAKDGTEVRGFISIKALSSNPIAPFLTKHFGTAKTGQQVHQAIQEKNRQKEQKREARERQEAARRKKETAKWQAYCDKIQRAKEKSFERVAEILENDLPGTRYSWPKNSPVARLVRGKVTIPGGRELYRVVHYRLTVFPDGAAEVQAVASYRESKKDRTFHQDILLADHFSSEQEALSQWDWYMDDAMLERKRAWSPW